MYATPDRLNISRGAHIQSPRTPASPSVSTVGASRVHDFVRKLLELYSKWQTTVQKGTQYCNAIENIKKGVLDPKAEDNNPYPANLELYCRNLAILNSILEDVLIKLDMILKQLDVLQVVMKDEVVGKSWNLGKVSDVLHTVLDQLRTELKNRRVVAGNIGHAESAAELTLHVSFWEQMSSQNEDVGLLIRMLSVEFDVSLE